MNKIYLFEAGSTKTTLLVNDSGRIEEYNLPGFNPNRYSVEFENELASLFKIEEGAKVYFYGSGLVEEENKKIVKELIYNMFRVVPVVYDDVTGAARALWGDKPGLVAIMGTGGVAAYYDGKKIIKRNGGHGYLIDDYGGGLELGKLILSAWLNESLPPNVDRAISDFLKIAKKDFVPEFYRTTDLKILASVVKIVPDFMNLEEVNSIVMNYFRVFFERHILPISATYNTKTLSIVGSIGVNFKSAIELTANDLAIKIEKIDNEPARALLSYHSSK